jgi:hypothetical protein
MSSQYKQKLHMKHRGYAYVPLGDRLRDEALLRQDPSRIEWQKVNRYIANKIKQLGYSGYVYNFEVLRAIGWVRGNTVDWAQPLIDHWLTYESLKSLRMLSLVLKGDPQAIALVNAQAAAADAAQVAAAADHNNNIMSMIAEFDAESPEAGDILRLALKQGSPEEALKPYGLQDN